MENFISAVTIRSARRKMPAEYASTNDTTRMPKTKSGFPLTKQAAHSETDRRILVSGFSRCSRESPGT